MIILEENMSLPVPIAEIKDTSTRLISNTVIIGGDGEVAYERRTDL